MFFDLSDKQKMIRSKAREFAKSEVGPTAAQRDEEERFDRGLFDKMGELGLTGIPWPERYGGIGADYVSYVMAVEELSRVCASTGVMLSVHTSLVGWCLYTYGTEEQKRKILRPIAQGKKLGAYSLTESSSGSDAKAMRTTATRDGSWYILNGNKIFVTNGGEAEIYLVFAITGAEQRSKGYSAFIIERGTEGFTFGKKEKKLGIRSSPTLELIFDNCRVSKGNLLGEEGEGFKIAMSALDGGRCGIAAQALGIAQGTLDTVIAFANDRKEFGKPLGHRQAIAFKIADMATKIEAARLLTYQAAWRESIGLPYGKEAAIAKLFSSDTAMQITMDALQIFGEYGNTKAYPVERFMRDAKVTQIYEGTNEIQRLVISRMVLAD
ncbi:acyl-CoA dehydrogenase [Cohnella sp.]|uniref:acyl-CoA dehydrogenase n=1 Tax=Cohnella sp. TaxID=1883426 RepID=UPI0035668656